MAPKKNKQREKQEQNRASSSARAHERLLASLGAADGAAPAFVGFSSFAVAPTEYPAASAGASGRSKGRADFGGAAAQSFYDGADHEIAVALKMLGKKGAVTKLKALNAFLVEILPPRKPADLRPMLGHFVQLYTAEMRDQNDRKVRQLLNEVLRALTGKLKPKAFAPHFKRLLPYWFVAMHDVNADVAQMASHAFEELFEDEAARITVVEEHLSAIVEEFQAFLAKTPDTFEGISMQPDEREERYERCVSAAVLSLNALVKLFAEAGKMATLQDPDATYSVANLLSSDKFARLTTASSKHPNFTRDSVRRAAYLTILTLCTLAKPIVEAKEDFFAKAILGAIGEKSSGNAENMWSALLTFLQTFPDVWHKTPSVAKFSSSAVFPKLFSQIRHGFHGSASTSFLTLLPLLSLFPLDVVVEGSSGRCPLYTGVLENCLKYLESAESRFHNKSAVTALFECLTAFFTIFLNSDAASEWFASQDESVVNTYVDQFEKGVISSFRFALTSPNFPDDAAILYVEELLKMHRRVEGFPAKNELSASIKNAFVARFLDWIRGEVVAACSKLTVYPSRFAILVRNGMATSNQDYWSSTSLNVYRELLEQLHSVVADPVFSSEKCMTLSKLLSILEVLYSSAPTELFLGGESVDEHFAQHYRPAICVVSGWVKIDRKASGIAMEKLLVISRSFFTNAGDKKAFLLHLFKDFDVQFGDTVEATAIIRHALQFPLSPERSRLWASCGSWQVAPAASAGSEDDSMRDGLTAIWKGKLLDEFLMISLKGRLDDLNPKAFQRLLEACLGGESNCPLVSPDSVVIFGHYVVQHGRDCSDLIVMMLKYLCRLFAKLECDLPNELAAVESQLLSQLFHLSVRGSYASDASTLWSNTAKLSMQKWQKQRLDAFISDLAKFVNTMLVSKPESSAAFNSHLFAAYAKKLLLLSSDPSISIVDVAEKLDFIHARCDEPTQSLFFNRLVSCFGEVCEDERVVKVLSEYYTQLAAAKSHETAELFAKLVDIDVSHAMTWFVFHPHETKASWGRANSNLEVLDSYLTLDALYESLRDATIFEEALKIKLANSGIAEGETLHRQLVFAAKGDESNVREYAAIASEEQLTQSQHEELESLVVGTMCLYASADARATLVEQAVSSGVNYNDTHLVGPVVASLVRENQLDGRAIKILSEFFDEFSMSALTQKNGRSFQSYLAVVTSSCQHFSATSAVEEVFPQSTTLSVLSAIQERVSPSSTTVVEVDDWIQMVEYISAIRPTAEIQEPWDKVVRVLITHAISGKQEVSKISSLKLHKRSKDTLEREKERGRTEHVYYEVARARLAVMKLLGALSLGESEVLHELTAFYREALLATVLCAFAESAEVIAKLETAYVSAQFPVDSFQLIQLSLTMEASLKTTFSAIHLALTSIHDTDRVRELVLECFGGIDGLSSLFDANRYPMTPAQRVLLYILAAYSGALRARSLADSTIDINADDEAATEAALAKALIPKALRKSLRAVFGGEKTNEGSSKIRMRSRRQKPKEREDLVGRLLLWDLFLQLFPRGAAASSDEDGANTPGMVASALSSYASNHKLLSNFLSFCTALLSQESAASLAKKQQQHALDLQNLPLYQMSDLELAADHSSPIANLSFDKSSVYLLGTRVFFRTAVRLPAMVRTWWNDECSRSERSWAAKYFEDNISPFMLASELEVITSASEAAEAWDTDEMTVKGSRVSREITTTYVKDECALEMVIRVPAAYPLRCVEVECTKRIGIAEDRWRRWVLQIIRVTSSQDGSLLDAVLLWKRNVDKEFEGVEPCPICYSILNPKTMGLPNLPCKTCSNKYHNSCLYKWFNQSGKNKCPICQQPFY